MIYMIFKVYIESIKIWKIKIKIIKKKNKIKFWIAGEH